MGDLSRRLVKGAVLAALAALTAGCEALIVGNPLFPKANVLVDADPQMTVMKLTYNFSTGIFDRTEENESKFLIRPRPGDIMPGVLFTDYELEFRDNRGQTISPLLLEKQFLGTAVYIPKSQGAGDGGKAIEIPIVSPQLWEYGESQGFVRGTGAFRNGWVPNTDPWAQNLTGVVTFYGKDDNQYPIQAKGTFVVRFETGIVPPAVN